MRPREHAPAQPSRAGVPLVNRMWVRLSLGSAALLVLAISFTAGFTLRFATGELRRNVMQRNEQISRRAAEEIASFVQDAHRGLAEISDVIQLLDRMPWVSDILLENQVLTSGVFETVVVTNRAGQVVADNQLGRVDLAKFPPAALVKAAAGADWMSPVDVDDNGLPEMTFVIPAGRSLALIARLSLESIWRVIDDIDAGPGGFAYLLSSDGTLIAYPDKAAVIRREHPAAPKKGAALLVSSPVPGLDWTVYIQQPGAMAFVSVSEVIRRSLLLVVIGLALVVFLGVVVARLYSRSLDALLRATVRIAGGDLLFRVDLRSNDEFGVLSRSFDDMVSRLRDRSAALQDSERRYRNVTESVKDIIFSLDGAGRIVFLNSRVEEVLGVPCTDLVGRTMAELVAQQAARGYRTAAPAAGAGDTGIPRELTIFTPAGKEVLLELESVRTTGLGGAVEVHGVARDITQRRRMEERLQRSERLAALGEIVSRVAHELRNAVAGISASMEMARTRGLTGERLERDLDMVLSEAERARGIVEGLLGSSTGRPVAFVPCSLDDAIGPVVTPRQRSLAAAGIEMILDLSLEMPAVMADPGQLKQVFHNIVDNAVHAVESLSTGGARKITIRTWGEAESVCAEIADTGPGIEPRDLGKVFDPFYTTRAESGGSGLGLAVSLGIAESLGGDISVRSVPGEGAAFTIRLPAAGAQPVPVAPVETISPAGRRILVVEDETSIREFVHHFLVSMGYVVDSVSNGEEAIATLANGTAYHLVISDFRMPDRNGKDLYDWIKVNRHSLLKRLIYITGDALNRATRIFLAETGVPYLLKPVAAPQLADLVRRALAEDRER